MNPDQWIADYRSQAISEAEERRAALKYFEEEFAEMRLLELTGVDVAQLELFPDFVDQSEVI